MQESERDASVGLNGKRFCIGKQYLTRTRQMKSPWMYTNLFLLFIGLVVTGTVANATEKIQPDSPKYVTDQQVDDFIRQLFSNRGIYNRLPGTSIDELINAQIKGASHNLHQLLMSSTDRYLRATYAITMLNKRLPELEKAIKKQKDNQSIDIVVIKKLYERDLHMREQLARYLVQNEGRRQNEQFEQFLKKRERSQDAGPVDNRDVPPLSKEHSDKTNETAKTKKIVAALKKSTEFAAYLRYHGPEKTDDPQRPRSIQFIGPGLPKADPPTIDVLQVHMNRTQVKELIDALAVMKYWSQAALVEKLPVPPQGPTYTFSVYAAVDGEARSYYFNLGWGLNAVRQLKAMRKSLEGNAVTALNQLLSQMSNVGFKWQKEGWTTFQTPVKVTHELWSDESHRQQISDYSVEFSPSVHVRADGFVQMRLQFIEKFVHSAGKEFAPPPVRSIHFNFRRPHVPDGIVGKHPDTHEPDPVGVGESVGAGETFSTFLTVDRKLLLRLVTAKSIVLLQSNHWQVKKDARHLVLPPEAREQIKLILAHLPPGGGWTLPQQGLRCRLMERGTHNRYLALEIQNISEEPIVVQLSRYSKSLHVLDASGREMRYIGPLEGKPALLKTLHPNATMGCGYPIEGADRSPVLAVNYGLKPGKHSAYFEESVSVGTGKTSRKIKLRTPLIPFDVRTPARAEGKKP